MLTASIRLRRHTVAIALAAAALLACSDSPLPGTMLGTYSVTGTLGTNSCGAGLGAPSPWTFSAQMSEQGTTIYWSWMDGSPPLSAPFTSGSVTLTTSQSANVDGLPDGGTGPCTMTRTDTLQIDLATGSPPPSFTGTVEYAFGVASGANCSDQLSVYGGMYDVLPCSTSYSVVGTRQ